MTKKNKISPYASRVQKLTKQLTEGTNRFIGEEDSEYQKFFKSALEKFGVESPDDIPDEKKDEFFNYVDANWDAGENETDVDEAITEPNKEDKPKVVDPSQTDIEKVDEECGDDLDEEEVVREMIRTELRTMMAESKKKD